MTLPLLAALVLGQAQAKPEAAVLGDWIAIATNGVSVKEMLRLTADHRFKITSIWGKGLSKKYGRKPESETGTWRFGTVDMPDEKGVTQKLGAVFYSFDKAPKYEFKLLFYRDVPVLTDILTTTFARPGDEARAYKLLYKKNYRPPWKD